MKLDHKMAEDLENISEYLITSNPHTAPCVKIGTALRGVLFVMNVSYILNLLLRLNPFWYSGH